MMDILVINGHEKYTFADGLLNQTLFENIVELLAPDNQVKTTVIRKGYITEDEQEKFKWADAVIFQVPVFWFSVPGAFKTYIDRVYAKGVFYEHSEKYGHGGLLANKKYMYSLTWNAPIDAFGESGAFFEGKSVDEVIFHLHKIQQFCGMQPLKTFSCHDVMKNPDIPLYLEQLRTHIRGIFG